MAARTKLKRKSYFVDERALSRAKKALGVKTEAEVIRLSVERVAEMEEFWEFMKKTRRSLRPGSVEKSWDGGGYFGYQYLYRSLATRLIPRDSGEPQASLYYPPFGSRLIRLRRGARGREAERLVADLYDLATIRWEPSVADWWEAGRLVRNIGDNEDWDINKRRDFQTMH
jgi:hypothetical protein